MIPRLPTGPTIVVCLTIIVAISFFIAPNRGLIWRVAREHRNRSRLQIEAVLLDLYVLYLQYRNLDRSHSIETLRTMSIGHGGSDRTLPELKKRGLVIEMKTGQWKLTEEGLKEAKELSKQREGKA